MTSSRPRPRSLKVTDPRQQQLAADQLVELGHGTRTDILAGAICVTGKRARKLLKRARRDARIGDEILATMQEQEASL